MRTRNLDDKCSSNLNLNLFVIKLNGHFWRCTLKHTRRQVFIIKFFAVCLLFLLKLTWPKNKSVYNKCYFYCKCIHNRTIDQSHLKPQTANCNEFEILTKLPVVKQLSLHEFALWGRDLVSVVRILPGTREQSLIERRRY